MGRELRGTQDQVVAIQGNITLMPSSRVCEDGPGKFRIAYDFSFGSSTSNANNIAMARVDVDGNGIDEIAVIRQKPNGKQRLFIFNAPPGPDADTGDSIAYDFSFGRSNSDLNNIAMAGVDLDGDGTDEIAVIREKLNGKQRLFIFNAPPGPDTDTGDPIAYDFSFGQSGTNADNIAMAGIRR